jgi:hypothetical protein
MCVKREAVLYSPPPTVSQFNKIILIGKFHSHPRRVLTRFLVHMPSFNRVSRSLTNPFNADPVTRVAASCDVVKKRSVVYKKTSLFRSLGAPMQSGVLARSAASMKRAVITKAEVLKHKRFMEKHSGVPTAAQKKMTRLECLNFYYNTPPTPLKCKKGGLLFEVEKVLGKMTCDCGRIKYLVKWAGYPHSENSCITKLPDQFVVDWA